MRQRSDAPSVWKMYDQTEDTDAHNLHYTIGSFVDLYSRLYNSMCDPLEVAEH